MAKSTNWKNKLLSSGVPLEHDLSRILADKGFSVSGEYPYTRRNFGDDVDCSTDIKACSYFPLGETEVLTGELHLLVECKYRSDEKIWLFTPDVNKADYSPAYPNGIRSFESYSTYHFDASRVRNLCIEPVVAMKGLEVNISNGDVHESSIKHGVNQLRYALPSLIHDLIDQNGSSHPDDCQPFFVLPILVTNAPLRMLRENVSLESVRGASDIDDLSEEVKWVDFFSDYADGFQYHAETVLRDKTQPLINIGIEKVWPCYHLIEVSSEKEKYYKYRSPLSGILSMSPMPADYKQFWVCNSDYFEELLEKVMGAINDSLSTSKQIVFGK